MSEIKRGLAHLTELEDLTEYRFTYVASLSGGYGLLLALEADVCVAWPCVCSDHELQTLIRYMDPNADGTLTLGEMEDAFIRAHAPMQVRSTPTFSHHCRRRNTRLNRWDSACLSTSC